VPILKFIGFGKNQLEQCIVTLYCIVLGASTMTSIMTKLRAHNTHLYAIDVGSFNLKMLANDIKLADNNPILNVYLLLKDNITKGTRASIHRIFPRLKDIQDYSITY